jgi:Arc/MetJ family transcription regulator
MLGAWGRTNVVVNEELVERAKRIYGLRTTREVIDLALHRLVGEISDHPHAGLLALEGIGWEADLDQMRGNDPMLDSWLNRPFEDDDPAPSTS